MPENIAPAEVSRDEQIIQEVTEQKYKYGFVY